MRGVEKEKMLAKLTIQLKSNEKKRYGYHNSSLLQGWIMEHIPPEYAEKMHLQGLNPYSQNIREQGGEIIWSVNTLNAEAKQNIIDSINDGKRTEIRLCKTKDVLSISDIKSESTSYKDLVKKMYTKEYPRDIRVNLLTPTSFKQNNRYCIFPSTRLFFQSLMKKYDACAEGFGMFDDEVLAHYEEYSHIIAYKLKSVKFSMEGITIPSFMGSLMIRISGPQQLVNLAWMLADFGRYSGVGIKTSIGMGSMEIL